jgi:hypothetical protein
MSFDLHLTVRGLCAFVPTEPLPDPETPPPHTVSGMRIVLLDVRQGDTIEAIEICQHDPILVVEQGQGAATVNLDGQQIEILTVDGGAPPIQLNPTFYTLADMTRIRPGFQVDSALFTTPPGRNDIVARLQLTTGRAFGIDPTPQPLMFATGPTPYTGRFATGVRLEIPIVGDQGSFVITPLQPNGEPQLISFAPDELGTPVRATLTNLCDPAEVHEEDGDFAAFFKLEGQIVRGPVLTPQLAANPGEVFGQATHAGVGTCIPAVTNSFSGS